MYEFFVGNPVTAGLTMLGLVMVAVYLAVDLIRRHVIGLPVDYPVPSEARWEVRCGKQRFYGRQKPTRQGRHLVFRTVDGEIVVLTRGVQVAELL